MVESGSPEPPPARHEHIESRQAELQERLSRRRGLRARRRPAAGGESEEAWLQELQRAGGAAGEPVPERPEEDPSAVGLRLAELAAEIGEVGLAASVHPERWRGLSAQRWLATAVADIERLLASRP